MNSGATPSSESLPSAARAAGEVELGPELVEDRLFEAGELGLGWAQQIEDDDLVLAGLQPGPGRYIGLRRADVPVAAEAVAVDPDDALAPVAQVEEGVGRLRHGERAAPEGRGSVAVVGAACHFSAGEFAWHRGGSGKICQPVRTRARFLSARRSGAVADALAVVDLLAEVHAAHRLDQNVERRRLGAGRQLHRDLAGAAVDDADGLAVDEDPGEVVDFAGLQRRRRAGGQRRAIEDAAVALIVASPSAAASHVSSRLRKVVEDRRARVRVKDGIADHRSRRRRLGQRLAGGR